MSPATHEAVNISAKHGVHEFEGTKVEVSKEPDERPNDQGVTRAVRVRVTLHRTTRHHVRGEIGRVIARSHQIQGF